MSAFDFFIDMNAIYRRGDLTATEKHLAIVVLSFRNQKTGACNPPVISARVSAKTGQITESLVSRSGLSDRAVQKTLTSLEAKGVFVRVRHAQAPADFTFTIRANDVHPEQGSPRTTFTLTPNDVHPDPEPRSPSPRTTFTQTTKKQQRNNKDEQQSSSARASSAPATRCPTPSSDEESLLAEAALWTDQQEVEPSPPASQEAPSPRDAGASQKPKKLRRERTASSAVKDKPDDISQEVWDDWLTTRRAKRLPLTQTALNSVRREAASAGLTFQAAVTFAVEQGWAAFRAEWYRRATSKNSPSNQSPQGRYLTAKERYEEKLRIAGQMSDAEYLESFRRQNQELIAKHHADA